MKMCNQCAKSGENQEQARDRERLRMWAREFEEQNLMLSMMHLPNKNTSRLSVNGGFRCAGLVFRLFSFVTGTGTLVSANWMCISDVMHFIRIKPSAKCELSSCMWRPRTVVIIPRWCTIGGYGFTDESSTCFLFVCLFNECNSTANQSTHMHVIFRESER